MCAYNEPKSDRAAHYFARELFFKGRYKSAAQEFKRHIDLNGWSVERSHSAVYLGDCMKHLGNEYAAVLAWQTAFNFDPNRRMPLLRLAEYYDKKGDHRRAAAYALASTAIPYRQYYIDDESQYRELPWEIAFRNLWYIGEDCREESKRCFDRALQIAPGSHAVVKNWHFYYPAPLVSIVIPTLSRPEKLERLLASIRDNAGYGDVEVVVEPDSFENRRGAPETFKLGMQKSKGDLVMYLGNDCIGHPDFVLQAVIQMYRAFGPAMDGLVCLNDGAACTGGKKATHWMGSKKLLPALGGEFFSTAYEHCFCDNELTDRCQEFGKYTFAPLARISHDNALNNGGERDEVLQIAYDPERFQRDQQTYFQRKLDFGVYPQVPKSIDLREKLKGLDTGALTVLNVGIGSMQSGIARQLPYWKFKRLDHIDTRLPFVEAARKQPWTTPEVNCQHISLQDFVIDFDHYDLVLLFDVLEHLPKADALQALDLFDVAGAKLLIFSPLEVKFKPEIHDHLSIWSEADFQARGYKTLVLKGFHGNMDALWACNWGQIE